MIPWVDVRGNDEDFNWEDFVREGLEAELSDENESDEEEMVQQIILEMCTSKNQQDWSPALAMLEDGLEKIYFKVSHNHYILIVFARCQNVKIKCLVCFIVFFS